MILFHDTATYMCIYSWLIYKHFNSHMQVLHFLLPWIIKKWIISIFFHCFIHHSNIGSYLQLLLSNVFLFHLSDDFAGHGNAFHGKGGRGNKRAQMRYCLHLMRSVVSLNDSEVNQDLVDQGAINQLLGEMGNSMLLFLLLLMPLLLSWSSW